MAVVNNTSDLGANIITGKNKHASNFMDRRIATVHTRNVLQFLHIPCQHKASTVRTSRHSKALYGCGATSAPEQLHRQLHCSYPEQHLSMQKRKWSADLTFQFASRGDDADPRAEVTARRAVTMRRMCTKDAEVLAILEHNYRVMHKSNVCGTMQDDTDLSRINPAQPKTSKCIDHRCPKLPIWPSPKFPFHESDATLDEKSCIHQHNEAPVAIMHIPYEHPKPVVRHLVTRARTRANWNGGE